MNNTVYILYIYTMFANLKQKLNVSSDLTNGNNNIVRLN